MYTLSVALARVKFPAGTSKIPLNGGFARHRLSFHEFAQIWAESEIVIGAIKYSLAPLSTSAENCSDGTAHMCQMSADGWKNKFKGLFFVTSRTEV